MNRIRNNNKWAENWCKVRESGAFEQEVFLHDFTNGATDKNKTIGAFGS